ncbi:hypothetical protein GGI21_005887, partial [Coemansia aciculifera]
MCRFGQSDIANDKRGKANSVVQAAWAHYDKIRSHEDAPSLLQQIPMAAVHLLIQELTFLRGADDYRRRFERIVQIFDDFGRIGCPIISPRLFSLYLRALNKLGRYQQAINEATAYGSALALESKDMLSINVLRQIMLAYFGGGRPDKALEVFFRVRDNSEYQRYITPHFFATAITGALNDKQLTTDELYSIAEDLLTLIEKPAYPDDSRTGLLNELLHAANKAGNHTFLFHLFERFVDRGFPIDHTTFGILLHCSCAAETDARAIYRVYHSITAHPWMQANMTHHVYAVFINCFVRHNRIDHALSVLHDLQLHPTAHLSIQHMSLIFSHYAQSEMATQALDLFHTVVETEQLAPTWT